MKNDELERLYEEMPWAFDRVVNDGPSHIRPEIRLKPKLPADLPAPTEDMMNRAVYLGANITTPVLRRRLFKGWALFKGRWKSGGQWCGDFIDTPYCIDINDPNARDIIALNQAEDEGRNPDTEPLVEQFRRAINITSRENISNTPDYLLAEYLESALQAYERAVSVRDERHPVAPPGESAWLRLDECEFHVFANDGSGWHEYTAPGQDDLAVYALKHGPASVRVRRKT